MKREPLVYIEDIWEALTKIESYGEGMSIKEFGEDSKTIDAVVRNFEIVGEASKQLDENIRNKYNHVPWKEMSRMRDKLIHAYFGVDIKIVWKTIKEQVPELKIAIQKVLDDIKSLE